MDFAQLALTALAATVVGVISTIHLFPAKLIDSRFKKKLESHKADLEKELDHSRFELNKAFNKFSMFHRKEVEVLTESWGLLLEAHWAISALGAGFHPGGIYTPSNYNPDELEDFMNEKELTITDKIQLRKSTDKDKECQKILHYKDLSFAGEKYRKFGIYFDKNKIYLKAEIKGLLSIIDKKLHMALNNFRSINYDNRGRGLDGNISFEANKLISEARELINEIEQQVVNLLDYSKDSTEQELK